MNNQLKILFVRLGSFGDVIHVLPALRALRLHLPQAEISWVVESGPSHLLRCVPDIDNLIVLPRKRWQREILSGGKFFSTLGEVREGIEKLRKERYDLVFDFHGNLRSGVVTALARGHRKYGFGPRLSKEFSHIFVNHRARIHPLRHKTSRYVELLKRAFPNLSSEIPLPLIDPGKEARQKVKDWLAELSSRGPLVVIHPGVSYRLRVKRWPASSFVDLAKRLTKEREATVVLSWGPGEEELKKRIFKEAPEAVFPTPWMFSIPEMVALFEEMDLLVACDTGPLHLATTLGRPLVGLYGPKPPLIYRPFFTGQVVIDDSLECISCNSRKCIYPDKISPCMQNIQVAQVLEACRKELKSHEKDKFKSGEALLPSRP